MIMLTRRAYRQLACMGETLPHAAMKGRDGTNGAAW